MRFQELSITPVDGGGRGWKKAVCFSYTRKVLTPKKSIGEHGFVGHFEDSEGNGVAPHSHTG
jgi:predicted enzyme related to lactoylglutathione lyase